MWTGRTPKWFLGVDILAEFHAASPVGVGGPVVELLVVCNASPDCIPVPTIGQVQLRFR